MSSVFSMELEGMTRAWPIAPLMRRKTRPTQNQAMISRRIFCSVVSFSCGFFGVVSFTDHRIGRRFSEQMKQTAPANLTGMNHCVGISGNAIENRAGAPRLARRFNGHINDDGSADDVFARDATGKAAVERIAAIIAHDEKTAGRNGVREDIFPSRQRAEIVVRVGGFGAADSVVFAKAGTIDPDAAVMNVDGFARQTNDALDDV